MNVETLTSLVRAFRQKIESAPVGDSIEILRRFPKGCCKVTAMLVATHLTAHGLSKEKMTFVSGLEGPRGSTHFWIEAQVEDGATYLIDLTADQFDAEPVLVTRDRSWHGRWSKQKRFPFDEVLGPGCSVEYAGWLRQEFAAVRATAGCDK